MFIAERSTDIDAPVQKVWDYLVDFSHWGPLFPSRPGTKLSVNLLESQTLRGLGAGRSLRMADDRGFVVEMAIKEFVAPKLLRVVAEGPPQPTDIQFVISPKSASASQVGLRYALEIEGGLANWLLKITSFEKKWALQVDATLERLKSALQAR